MFELKARAGWGRVGRLQTSHGSVETPALLPVVSPSNLVIPPQDLADRFGVQMLITNAYILWKGPQRDAARERGLHDFLDFQGPIMTDSGAFQQHVYGRVEASNEEIVRYQASLDADFGTVLDVFSEPDASHPSCEADQDVTLRRAREAAAWREEMGLVGTVQGGLFPDLRERCGRALSELDLQIHAIGGVVPLLERYRFADLVDVIVASKRGLRSDRPVHLFGAGHPLTFGLAVLLGCDLFDSAAYAKYAQNGRMITRSGTRPVREVRKVACRCPACVGATPSDLQTDAVRLAEHNLHVSLQELGEVTQAIHEGTLWEHVERRARAHPALLQGVKRLRHHLEFLERGEDLSHGRFFYTGPESIWRPVAHRFRARVLERYAPPTARRALILPEASRPFSRTYAAVLKALWEQADAHAIVRSALGPVPIELDAVYPIAQSVFPDELEVDVQEAAEAFLRAFLRRGDFEGGRLWEGEESIQELAKEAPGPTATDPDRQRVRAVADFQFGVGAGEALLQGDVRLEKSRKTSKIRTVHVDDEHVLSLRARDGFFTMKLAGARRLHAALPTPALRVTVDAESAPLNREGKNVFAKFVVDCDPDLRPGDEALVVDEEDALLAVGRVVLNREEMLAFSRGLAVKVREGSGLL